MSQPLLTSKDNPLVRAFRLAAAQSRRNPPDLVLAEGLRVLEEAAGASLSFEAVLAAEQFGAYPREQALLKIWRERNVTVRRASASLLKDLSDVVTHQGAMALVHVPEARLEEIRLGSQPLILCLAGIHDPGNMGTLIRAAGAAGVSLVCCTQGTVSARNPKVIRSSAGVCFHLPIVESLDPAAFLAFCKCGGFAVYAASAHARSSLWERDLCGPTALVLGNEAHGLDATCWSAVEALRIPMAAGVESLNVGVAGSILMYEAFRQRARDTGCAAPLGQSR